MRRFLYILTAFLSLHSCNFLEVEHTGKSDIESYFSETEALEPAIRGVYNLMNNFYEQRMLIYPEVAGDLLYLSPSNTEWAYQYNFTSRYEDETSSVGYIWKNGYNIILNVNHIIQYAPQLRNGNTGRLVDNTLAQAYFVRALMHFDLCRTYAQTYTYTADASHPGVPIMTYIPDIKEKMVRSSVKKVYEQVIDDLKTALSLFNSSVFNEYFASPEACKALLARVYLYMEDYDNAILYSGEMIERFGLTENSRYRQMYTSVGVRGGEGIFRINNLLNTTALSSFYRYDAPQGRPSAKLKGLFTDPRDIRKGMFSHTAYSETDKKKVDYTDINIKFHCTDSIADRLKHYDPFLLRGSEMYLIRAEALCKKDLPDEAAKDIKALQARALGITPGEVTLVYSDAASMMSIIKEERMKELCFEGHRLFDLTRWHDTLSRDTGSSSSIRTIPYPDYRFILPIPQIEMESNDKMIQNPTSNEQ